MITTWRIRNELRKASPMNALTIALTPNPEPKSYL